MQTARGRHRFATADSTHLYTPGSCAQVLPRRFLPRRHFTATHEEPSKKIIGAGYSEGLFTKWAKQHSKTKIDKKAVIVKIGTFS